MNMGMQLGQSQRLEQTISPQMLQSATILQKTSQELESAIVQEVESNPLLELDDEIPEGLPESPPESPLVSLPASPLAESPPRTSRALPRRKPLLPTTPPAPRPPRMTPRRLPPRLTVTATANRPPAA